MEEQRFHKGKRSILKQAKNRKLRDSAGEPGLGLIQPHKFRVQRPADKDSVREGNLSFGDVLQSLIVLLFIIQYLCINNMAHKLVDVELNFNLA